MPRTLYGTVVSDKQDKTIIVRVDRQKNHPLYRKQFTLSKRFAVHDEKNEASKGDKVEFTETRPVSKSKKWALVKVLEKALVDEGVIQ